MNNNIKYYNFGAGPSMIPLSILKEVKKEFLNWQGLGISIVEIGHKTYEYIKLMEENKKILRLILNIPDNYHILFLSGNARTHFAMIPINFLSKNEKAGYWISGIWSLLAYQEAYKIKKAYCIANNSRIGFFYNLPYEKWKIEKDTKYLYFTSNETINGIRFYPDINKIPYNIPLISDMTSSLLTEPINIKDYDLIFAGGQKNISNSGLVIVILNKNILDIISNKFIPTMLDYRIHVKENSSYATPPIFNCYLASKTFKWIQKQGGISNLYRINKKKSKKLYEFIDSSDFYYCKIEKNVRSLINICFYLRNKNLEKIFVEEAKKNGFLYIKGHYIVGGIRISLYNAMPLKAVKKLIKFMQEFSKQYKHNKYYYI
ncbi:3-phosphoserine/phosphohydroxythreonine transaminase [Candidatus Legionella polyplacis]|uniref:Phosphoserine aminotransferase n=1 Tax=Candidatus Legionella polyplacis TaxID=2005262 RepID=A0ABZ2GVW8_9GAMM